MLYDTPSEFLAYLRRQMADTVAPYLWSDDDMYYYIDNAQRDWAVGTRCITDGVTFTGIDVEADNAWVPFDPAIIDIKRAILTTKKTVLKTLTVEEMSDNRYRDDYGIRVVDNWETCTGSPTHLILNADQNHFRFYPIPTEDDSLDLTVWREPLSAITDSNSAFEIEDRWIRFLQHGVFAQAYNRQDYETFDASRAADEHARFLFEIQEAKSKITRRVRRPRPVVYGGL